MDKMLSIRKAAKVLGVTTYTLRNWARLGKIKAVKMPNNSDKAQWFISEDELLKMQKGRET